jgi:parvulin-like peptidyl-prolyl isomerase
VRYRGAVAAPPGVTRTREEALAKAEALRAEVIAHPETFATRARAESEDNFAARGGRVGWLTRGNEDITYENAAFALERGGVSPVVETVIGFFVVRRDG